MRRHAEGLLVVQVLEPGQIGTSFGVHAADGAHVVDALVEGPNQTTALADAHGRDVIIFILLAIFASVLLGPVLELTQSQLIRACSFDLVGAFAMTL